MDWLSDIPARINKEGYLQLVPENDEPLKSVIDIDPFFQKAVDYEITNGFPGVLS